MPNGTVFPVVRCRFDIALQAASSRNLMETMQTRLDGATDPRVASFWLHLLCAPKPLLRLRLRCALRHLAGVAADAVPCGHQPPPAATSPASPAGMAANPLCTGGERRAGQLPGLAVRPYLWGDVSVTPHIGVGDIETP